MRDDRSPAPRSRRGSHARPSGVSGRLSASMVSRPARTPRPRPERGAPPERGRGAASGAPSALGSVLGFVRRLGEVRWEPAALRRLPHPRSIRARVVCLLVVPIVSLMTLWGLAAVQAAQTVYTLIQLKQLDAAVHAPADSVISSLQQERTGVGRLLGGPATVQPDAALEADYTATDAAAAALRTGTATAAAPAAGLGAAVQDRISSLIQDLRALPALRGEAARRQVTWATAQAGYTRAVDDALALEGALATVQDGEAPSDAWPVLELARGRELLARQTALAAFAQAGGGGLDTDTYRQYVGAYYAQAELEQSALTQVRAADADAYRRVTSTPAYQRLRAAQAVLVANGNQGPNGAASAAEQDLAVLAPPALTALGTVVADAGSAAIAQADPYGRALATKAGIGVALGLVAVTAALLVSVWIGRGLVVELGGLRDAALDLARRRLPRAIARLRAGETVDVAAETMSVARVRRGGGRDEVGQVAEALDTVHHAALRAAAERAEAVSGVAAVFLNLARRSQVLLHRQLGLLDLMERRVDDPADLEDLFRLDHLATRMRRHAEGLIILSGAAPGRGWRRPVPLVDVVRAAVAEVEDYARVDVRRMPQVRVAGAAVADLAHLLAELVENATAFSPPHTRVHVQGEQVAAGYVLEIEDRGLGMGEDALAEANRRIDSARQSDLFDSDRLGLFVVSRLARRHEVKVALRTSDYGGTTAVVLLPSALLEADGLAAAPAEAAAQTNGSANGATNGSVVDQHADEYARERDAVLVGASGAAPAEGAGGGSGSGPDSGDLGFGADGDGGAGFTAHQPTDPGPAGAGAFLGYGAEAPAGPPGPGLPPDGLPRRVRQANLAPGLRAEPGRAQRSRDEDGDPAARSPEQARATMAAFQRGWSLGQVADAPDVTGP
jgi:signal transduction histidine kinase